MKLMNRAAKILGLPMDFDNEFISFKYFRFIG
jgi:hypothetical protein